MALIIIAQAEDFLQKISARSISGQGLVEYALIILFIAMVVIASLVILGDQLNNFFGNISNGFPP